MLYIICADNDIGILSRNSVIGQLLVIACKQTMFFFLLVQSFSLFLLETYLVLLPSFRGIFLLNFSCNHSSLK